MSPAPARRLASLDALRGLAVAAMVLVNNPGDWNALYPPLAHARWHGWTFTDTVFPFFLFAVGVSMTISFGERAAAGASRASLLLGLARRAVVLFAIGLALNAFPAFDLAQLRIPGVLQRIALASLLAAPFVAVGGRRVLLTGALALCAVYSLLMLVVPVPDVQGVVAAGALEPGRDFGAWLDRLLLDGHLWRATRTWDPEGVTSTLPAAASVLFGALAGGWLQHGAAPAERTVWLLLGGLAALAIGTLLDAALMPINKNLWTPSYAVFMAGWAACVFGALHWLLDAAPQARLRQRSARALQPLVIVGMNALALFVLSGLLGRLLLTIRVDGGARPLKTALYAPLQALPLAPENASLLWALCAEVVVLAVGWGLWKRGWFIKV